MADETDATLSESGWKYVNGNVVNETVLSVPYANVGSRQNYVTWDSDTNRAVVELGINGAYYPTRCSDLTSKIPELDKSDYVDYTKEVVVSYPGLSISMKPKTGRINYHESNKGKNAAQKVYANEPMISVFTIKKDSTLNPDNYKSVYFRFVRLRTKSSVYSTTTTSNDISAMISHIKTCTGGGWQTNATQHWKICNTCGYVASAKANHSFTTTKAATCTAAGTKKCNTCGYTASIPALGHSYSNAWTSDNSNHWHKCTRCSATSVVAAHPWTYSNVTASTHDKKCNTCGKAITKEAHSFVNNRCACGRYNQVTVSFNVNMPSGVINGPSPSAIAPVTYTYGDKYLDGKYKVPTPSMLDHTFLGWYTSASGGTKIETSTTVTNVNAHTLYAHWERQPMTVEDIYLDSVEVIEYAGIPEEEYRRLYEPEEDVPYESTKVRAKITGTVPSHYQYLWEYLDSDGEWKPATTPLFNPLKSEIEIPNVSRDLNNIKLLLSIKNNYNEVIESNECTITVYYRPNSNTINIENQN